LAKWIRIPLCLRQILIGKISQSKTSLILIEETQISSGQKNTQGNIEQAQSK
jgi:hypothetical protein